VAFLLDEGLLGGFHFNNRKYADDDLIVGTVNPFEMFLIYNELVAAELDADKTASDCAKNVAYMIDQSHNIEPKLEAMLQSVLNCQTAYAKALLVDRQALDERRVAQDVLGAYRVLTDAYETDVRPLLAQVRVEMGLNPNPIAAYQESSYPAEVAQERGSAEGSGGGYPSA
jgi:L-rhamnose isomerase/sugar isomerase